jgi:FdhE protein
MATNHGLRPTRRDGQELLAQMIKLKDNSPELTEVVDLQHDLLAAKLQIQVDLAPPHYSADEVQARFGQGIPLLRPQEMALDWVTFSDLCRQVCKIAAQHRPDLSDRFEELLTLLDDEPARVKALVTVHLEEGHLMAAAKDRETESEGQAQQRELAAFVFNHTLHPFLQAYADALVPMLEQRVGPDWDKFWRKGNCPICGGEPDLAFLDEKSGNRHLVCSRCNSDWLFPRIKCPFCGTGEPSKLSYYPSTDSAYRVYVCQNCQRYLKAIDLRQAGRRAPFCVERITTIDLDLAAREEGFH